jgi:hypothetical protein
MKKFGYVIAIFLVLGVVSTFAQEVQSGVFSANSTSAGYSLNKESGDRTYSIEVNFAKGFDVKPSIILSVSLLEADKDTNVRYDVVAKSISRDGFMITIKTWSDTKIYTIGGSWLAVSPGK